MPSHDGFNLMVSGLIMANPTANKTLIQAIKTGNKALFEASLADGADVNEAVDGEIPLVCAAACEQFDFFGVLISRQDIKAGATDGFGCTASSALMFSKNFQRQVWAFYLLEKKGIPMPSNMQAGYNEVASDYLMVQRAVGDLKKAYDSLGKRDPRRWFFPSRVANALIDLPANGIYSANNVLSVIQACHKNPSRFQRFCMRFYRCFDCFFKRPLMEKLGNDISLDKVNALFFKTEEGSYKNEERRYKNELLSQQLGSTVLPDSPAHVIIQQPSHASPTEEEPLLHDYDHDHDHDHKPRAR